MKSWVNNKIIIQRYSPNKFWSIYSNFISKLFKLLDVGHTMNLPMLT